MISEHCTHNVPLCSPGTTYVYAGVLQQIVGIVIIFITCVLQRDTEKFPVVFCGQCVGGNTA